MGNKGCVTISSNKGHQLLAYGFHGTTCFRKSYLNISSGKTETVQSTALMVGSFCSLIKVMYNNRTNNNIAQSHVL